MSGLPEQEAAPTLADFVEFNLGEVARLSVEAELLDREIEKAEDELVSRRNAAHAARGIYRARRPGQNMPEQYLAAVRERERQVVERKRHQTQETRVQPVNAVAKQRRWKGRSAQYEETEILQEESRGGTLEPSSMAFTKFKKRYEAPRQSFTGPTTTALLDSSCLGCKVSIGQYLWILYHFDRNGPASSLKASPPRLVSGSGEGRPGVFATRAPNRPTPVGLTLGRVIKCDPKSGEVVLEGVDILDETPVLAIRGYRDKLDSFPNTRAGWLDREQSVRGLYYDADQDGTTQGRYFLEQWSDLIHQKLSFVNDRSEADVFQIVRSTLTRDALHCGRRYGPTSNGIQRRMLGVGSYRILYEFDQTSNRVWLIDICSGLRTDVIESDYKSDIEVWEHRKFIDEFGRAKY